MKKEYTNPRFKKLPRVVLCLLIFCFSTTLAVAQSDMSLVYGIDTSFHANENNIVKHQVFLKSDKLFPFLEIIQNRDDFQFVGTMNHGDSIICIFNNYNSPVGLSRYFIILPFLNQVYTVNLCEYESAFLDSIDLLSNTIYFVSFETECGVLNKKDLSTFQIKDYTINELSIETIMEYPLK